LLTSANFPYDAEAKRKALSKSWVTNENQWNLLCLLPSSRKPSCWNRIIEESARNLFFWFSFILVFFGSPGGILGADAYGRSTIPESELRAVIVYSNTDWEGRSPIW